MCKPDLLLMKGGGGTKRKQVARLDELIGADQNKRRRQGQNRLPYYDGHATAGCYQSLTVPILSVEDCKNLQPEMGTKQLVLNPKSRGSFVA